MTDEIDCLVAVAGERVAEALRLTQESGNPFADAALTSRLAQVGLMRLDVAREAVERICP